MDDIAEFRCCDCGICKLGGPKRYALDENSEPYRVHCYVCWVALTVPAKNAGKWRVAYDRVAGCEVSTVFLGSDYSHGCGPVGLFETALSGPEFGPDYQHYETRAAAAAGHRATVASVERRN